MIELGGYHLYLLIVRGASSRCWSIHNVVKMRDSFDRFIIHWHIFVYIYIAISVTFYILSGLPQYVWNFCPTREQPYVCELNPQCFRCESHACTHKPCTFCKLCYGESKSNLPKNGKKIEDVILILKLHILQKGWTLFTLFYSYI